MAFPSQNQRVVIQTVDAAVGDIMVAKGGALEFVPTPSVTPTHYVSLTGVDGAGVNGSLATPWRTLAYASTRVTSGNVVQVLAGTYSENTKIQWPVGVSLCGVRGTAGEHLTRIDTLYNGGTDQTNFWLNLQSATITDGAQFIRDIWFDGGHTKSKLPDVYPAVMASHGILIDKRNNVKVFNNRISNFWQIGIIFRNNSGVADVPPSTFCTGNEFYNNYLYNCSCFQGGFGSGMMQLSGQDTMRIYNNHLKGVGREIGKHGYLIKFDGSNGAFIKNTKIYRNNIEKWCEGEPFDFAIELWDLYGGTEIYENYFLGSIDMSQNHSLDGTGYDYEMWVHDNVFGPEEPSPSRTSFAIDIEIQMNRVIFERNYCRNIGSAVAFVTQRANSSLNNVTIRNNLVKNGNLVSMYSSGNSLTNVIQNLVIANNTVIQEEGSSIGSSAVSLPNVASFNNVTIINNIFIGFWQGAVWTRIANGYTCNNLNVSNNIVYKNTQTNNVVLQTLGPVAITNLQQTGNINNLTALPIRSYTDFRLADGSPAINAGLTHAATPSTDFTGFTRTGNPDIGAYEYH